MAARPHPESSSADLRSDCLSVDELRGRLEGEHRLLMASEVLAAVLDRAEALTAIVREGRALLGCTSASLFVFEPDRGALAADVTTDPMARAGAAPLEWAVADDVARHRAPVDLADPAQDERFAALVEPATRPTAARLRAVPLLAADGPLLGVLQLRGGAGPPFDALDGRLLSSYCRHAAAVLERVRRIDGLRQRRSFRASLQVAREIQRGFMPSQMPPISGYEAATWWMANDAVGGDYCDVIPLRDQRVALTIADVSGHGLGPSLIMAAVRAALHALVLEHTEPEVLLNLLGRSLSQDLKDGHFITMLLGVLDPIDHSMEYANAGHGPALHYQAELDEFVALESTGMPIGVVDWPAYHQGWPLTLDVGDLLVFCTDGIVEVLDPSDRPFGRTGLETTIRAGLSLPVPQIVARVGQAVQDHHGDQGPPDDLTILAVRRTAT